MLRDLNKPIESIVNNLQCTLFNNIYILIQPIYLRVLSDEIIKTKVVKINDYFKFF